VQRDEPSLNLVRSPRRLVGRVEVAAEPPKTLDLRLLRAAILTACEQALPYRQVGVIHDAVTVEIGTVTTCSGAPEATAEKAEVESRALSVAVEIALAFRAADREIVGHHPVLVVRTALGAPGAIGVSAVHGSVAIVIDPVEALPNFVDEGWPAVLRAITRALWRAAHAVRDALPVRCAG
jgi:hypothetical protein